MISLFRMYDSNPSGLVMFTNEKNEVYKEAEKWNEQKWGIFWCPNMNREPDEMGNYSRLSSRVADKDINYWYCDLDEGSKQEQWERIMISPMMPTFIVESSRGFHLYWRAVSASVENFSTIENRIIEYFNADKKAKDLVRILRLWNYKHWKDNNNPFEVKIIMYDVDIKYSEEQMFCSFPMSEVEKRGLKVTDRQVIRRFSPSEISGDNIYEQIKRMNQKMLLQRLSGTSFVNGETYEFIKQTNHTETIYVNGKSTGCFINEAGDIIADKFYSNNIINWLKWPDYNHTHSEIYQILQKIVKEAF
jgi:hypothetical protein